MKAALFYGGRDIRVEELPDPSPPGEVLVRIGAARVCGSDLHPCRGADPWGGQVSRSAPGRTRAGRDVAAIGAGVTRVEVGQRVGVEPMHLVGCGSCRQCRRGDYHVCPTRGLRNGVDTAAPASRSLTWRWPRTSTRCRLDLARSGLAARRLRLRRPRHQPRAAPGIGVRLRGRDRADRPDDGAGRPGGRRPHGHHDRAPRRAAGVRPGGARPTLVVNNTTVESVGEAVADLTHGELCDAVFETVGGTEDTMAQAVEAAAFGGVIGIIGAFWGDVAVAYRAANRKSSTCAGATATRPGTASASFRSRSTCWPRGASWLSR